MNGDRTGIPIDMEDVKRYLGSLWLERELLRDELMRLTQELQETQQELEKLKPQEPQGEEGQPWQK